MAVELGKHRVENTFLEGTPFIPQGLGEYGIIHVVGTDGMETVTKNGWIIRGGCNLFCPELLAASQSQYIDLNSNYRWSFENSHYAVDLKLLNGEPYRVEFDVNKLRLVNPLGSGLRSRVVYIAMADSELLVLDAVTKKILGTSGLN